MASVVRNDTVMRRLLKELELILNQPLCYLLSALGDDCTIWQEHILEKHSKGLT